MAYLARLALVACLEALGLVAFGSCVLLAAAVGVVTAY